MFRFRFPFFRILRFKISSLLSFFSGMALGLVLFVFLQFSVSGFNSDTSSLVIRHFFSSSLFAIHNSSFVIPQAGATSLAQKDTSGTFTPATNETEMVSERTRSFKKYRLPDSPDGRARYRVGGSVGPIHYKLDPDSETETYKEIDLTVLPCTLRDRLSNPLCGFSERYPDYYMDKNGYQVRFWNAVTDDDLLYVALFRRDGHWLKLNPIALVWENAVGERQLISLVQESKTPPVINNDEYTITWSDVFGPGLDFRYNLSPDKFFKTVIVNQPENLPQPTIGTQGLKLTVVLGLAWDEDTKLGNNFAGGITTELPSPTEYLGTMVNGQERVFDEVLDNPDEFAYTDQSGKSVWWLHQPKAWDSGTTTQQTFLMDWILKRQEQTVFADVSLPAEALSDPDLVYPLYIDAAIPEEQVEAGMDDGYSYEGSYGTDRRARTYFILDFSGVAVGNGLVRFTTVPIPQGATIDAATVTLTIQSVAQIDTTFYAEDVDSATDLADPNPLIDNRNRTTASVATGPLSLLGANGSDWTTPSLVGPVQEVIDRAGWVSGNALAIIGIDANTGSNSGGQWASYEHATYAPTRFNATYTEAPTGGISIGSSITPDAYFSGLIDEVRIFNRALSASEAVALFNLGKTVLKR